MTCRFAPVFATLLLTSLPSLGCSDSTPGTEEESGAGSEEVESTDGDTTDTDTDTDTGDGDGETGDGDGDGGETVPVSGDAFAFGPYTMIANASVSILELPDTTVTDDAGHFVFEALPAGESATFVFEKAGYPVTHTKTFTLPSFGSSLEQVTFQVPDDATFDLLASIVGIEPDPATCQIASTVTRVGKSIYDEGAHGEAGATVTIEPALPPEHGPIYFNASVIPQLDLTETSEDGGVLYVNVPPGNYTLSATKPGVDFIAVDVVCAAGVLVNPSPPYGLQAL